MTRRLNDITQQQAARIAGIAYLLVIAAGIFAEFFVRSSLIVPGDATATANNILGAEWLFRIGFASDLVMLSSDIVVAIALYVLLRPIARNLALMATFFRLAMASILGVNMLNIFAALVFLSGAEYLAVFQTDQLHALALLALDAHAMGYSIGLIFFGLGTMILGYLLFLSRYVPRVLSVMLALASMVYIIGSFVHILAPDLVTVFSFAYALPFIAELGLALWLSIKGANIPQKES